jgi:tryptophan-rich sensory protein
MYRFLIYATFILGVVAVGVAIGTITRPDAWYAALVKPSFNPPNWVFAPVWTLLYTMIGAAGARTFERSGGLRLWLMQMALNFAWTPAFFGLHRPALALVIVLAMFVVIIAFIVTRWNSDRVSALLFVPYAAWVAFATAVNASIVVLN